MVNFLLLNEAACTLFADEVSSVEYQFAVAEYCARISFALNAFPNSVVQSTMLILLVVDNNVLLRIVDYDISIEADFDRALAVVHTKQLSLVSGSDFYCLVERDLALVSFGQDEWIHVLNTSASIRNGCEVALLAILCLLAPILFLLQERTVVS